MTTALEGGWAFTETAGVFRLEKSSLEDRLAARKRLVTAFGSLLTAVALGLAGLDAPPGIGLVVWPMVGLFVLVSGLGVWAFAQARLAVKNPLVLEARVNERSLVGRVAQARGSVVVSFADVARVEVVREPGLTVPVLKLQVVTTKGLVLLGPELMVASGEARASEALLASSAERLAKVIGCAYTQNAGAIEEVAPLSRRKKS